MAWTRITGTGISNTTKALIKDLNFIDPSGIFTVPVGTTAQRPTVPSPGTIPYGTIRFNTTKDSAEIYNTQTGVADWNGIGSETGVDGGDSFVRTNGTTITKNITIGPTANSDQKYTYGFLTGDITIADGVTVDIESGAGLAIIDEDPRVPLEEIGGASSDIMYAAGGNNVADVGLYRVHTFTENGTFTPGVDGTVEVLIVAGGGGGGFWYSGGGGGGGVLYVSQYSVTAGTPYTVEVGNGGLGQTSAPSSGGTQASYGLRGGDSKFGPFIAKGGGGGPGYNASPGSAGEYQFIDGGSGGGGRLASNGPEGRPFRTYTPASGTFVQAFGHRGGVQGGSYGGGGGGAGEPGNSGSTDGKGGDGIFFNFDGVDRYYAAGGGGGTSSGTSQGGLGGGGIGTTGTTSGSDATGYGCGGGGGGTGSYTGGTRGGNGSKGVVMVRYITKPTNVQSFTTIGTTTWNVPAGADTATVLVVGGGGGGAGTGSSGAGPRGGGGAGGFVWRTFYNLVPGQSIQVTVGNGGAGGSSGSENDGGQGQNSTFGILTSIGGGSGGRYNGASLTGSSGGSGGGTAYTSGSTQNVGTLYQGYRGGTGQFYGNSGGSGGGGAGGAGYDIRQSAEPSGGDKGGDTGGDGGEGRITAISGSPTFYAGGGGAGGYPSGNSNYGLGGSGIGGRGTSGGGTATQGVDATGSGGGAGGSSAGGARGGSGIVIVRYGNTNRQVSDLGISQYNPATSAKQLVDSGLTENGVYYIQASPSAPLQQIYCILDPNYDGGGWMIIANNNASGVIYNSGHIPRATAYSPYVGTTGANSYTPSNNFSINCTDMNFNKLVWVVMNSNGDNTFIGASGTNVTGYIHYQWTNSISIPSNTQYWAVDQGTSGFTMGTQVSWPGFGNKRMNSDYGGYGQYGSQNYGFGTMHNSSYSTVTRGSSTNYKLYGSGGAYYPATVTFQGSAANSGNTDAYYCWSFTDAYGTTAGAAQQAIGFDDWQDGSGLGDQWRVENTNDKSTTRGKPSFIMIKST